MGTSISSGRWKVDYTNQRVYRDTAITPTVTDTANDLYSDLMGLFDDAAQMDDPEPISAQTPTEYTIIKQWFLDDESPKYLTGGAIQTSGYSSGSDHYVRAVEYTSTTAFIASDIGKVLTGGTTADTGTILAYDERYGAGDGIVWLRVDDPTPGGDEFDQSETYSVASSTAAGSVTNTNSGSFSQTGESLWANPYIVTTLPSETRAYAVQAGTKITDAAQGWPAGIGFNSDGSIDVVLKVSEFGNLIDDGVTIWFARRGGTLYDNFEIDLSVGGRQPVPLSPGADAQNDGIGHHNATWTGGSGSTMVVGEVIQLNSDSEVAAIVAATSDTGGDATGDFDYFLIRGLTQLSNSDAVTAQTSTKTLTIGTVTNNNPVSDAASISVTHGAITRNINNGNGARPYSIDLDPATLSWLRVYQALKYITRRGSTTQIDGQDGEQYTGNAVQLEYGTQTGSFVEGEVVYGQTSGAFGTVVADHDDGATGDLILRDVRGTFTTEVVGDAASGPTDFATVTSVRTIATPKTSPLGTYAGGTFFGAPGVVPVLANIGAGEANNYQLVDDDGITQSPPVQVSVGVTSGAAGVRVSVFRLLSAGGDIDKDEYGSHNTNNVAGDTDFEVDASISSQVPAAGGWFRVEYDTDLEDRYAFDSYTGAVFTLTSNANWTGRTATSADPLGITLTDSGATFQTDGVLPGMMVRNVTDGSVGVVDSVTSQTELVLEARLTGGTEDDWDVSDSYEINRLVRTYDNTDNVYIPFLDDVLTGTNLSRNIVYGGDVPVLIRSRQGGTWLPFEVENTIDSGGMSQALILTPDTIAT